jgi:hypothetical protein
MGLESIKGNGNKEKMIYEELEYKRQHPEIYGGRSKDGRIHHITF